VNSSYDYFAIEQIHGVPASQMLLYLVAQLNDPNLVMAGNEEGFKKLIVHDDRR